jgi:prenylcysteine oxidase/farnesylcysteine lyase
MWKEYTAGGFTTGVVVVFDIFENEPMRYSHETITYLSTCWCFIGQHMFITFKWAIVAISILAMILYQLMMFFNVPVPVIEINCHACNQYKIAKKTTKPRIAIVGGGIAGASSAYYIRELFGENVHVSVFEKSNRLGGRTHSAYTQDGTRYDVGGTSVVIENYYAINLMKRFNLTFSPKIPDRLVVWDEKTKKIIFQENESEMLTKVNTLIKYNLEIFSAKMKIRQTMNKFLKIYELQNNAITFDTVGDLVDLLGFQKELNGSFEEYITTNKMVSEGFWRDILIPILGVNYNQNSTTTAFASLISSSAIVSSFHTLMMGTDSLSRHLMHNSSSNVYMNTTVEIVERLENGKFKLSYQSCDGSCRHVEEIYDRIVLATPIELSSIQLVNIRIPEPRKFVNVKVTFIVGNLNGTLYGLDESELHYSIITTTQDEQFGVFKLSPCGMTKSFPIYKIFSQKEIPDAYLEKHFKVVQEVYRYEFDAYPLLQPGDPANWHHFKMGEGIYQVNAMESIVSTIETELISSRNIALMLLKEFGKK